jgi:hypothetical protein
MGRVVFLGHGGFDPTTGSDVAVILVPPGTSLKFFSDAGQALALPSGDVGSDYNKVVKVWDHFKEAEAPIAEKGVTYNFRLSPEDSQEERDLALSLDWGAQVVTLPQGSDKFYLCTGTAATCPTPKLNVAAGRHDELVAKGDPAVQAFRKWMDGGGGSFPAEIADFEARLADVPADYYQYVTDGVPAERWNHHCNGILTKHAGNELYWVACTSFVRATPGRDQLPTLVTSDSPGPAARGLEWTPTAANLKEVRETNAKKVKDTAGGGTLPLVAAGTVVLIGGGHAGGPADWVRSQPDIEEGMLTVTKGGAFSAGKLEVKGISAMQALVTSEIDKFSDKKVTFE